MYDHVVCWDFYVKSEGKYVMWKCWHHQCLWSKWRPGRDAWIGNLIHLTLWNPDMSFLVTMAELSGDWYTKIPPSSPFLWFFQPSQVLRRGLLGKEPPSHWWRTKCPPITSGPGHGTVHPRADGRINQLRGHGPSSHPPAHRGQPGTDEAANLPAHGQTAGTSAYEPMTHRATSWLFLLFLFSFVIFLRKKAKRYRC